jgi:hypothetical protein
MYKNSIGELKLLPIKDEGKFIFLNDTIRVNGKLNKGDYIKILVHSYHQEGDRHILTEESASECKLIVRNEKMLFPDATAFNTIEDLYENASEYYKKQFYFGKTGA